MCTVFCSHSGSSTGDGIECDWRTVRYALAISRIRPVHREPDSLVRHHRKQAQFLDSSVHFVEIDLLRGGTHTVVVPEAEIAAFGRWDYLVTLRDRDLPADWNV